MVNEGVRSESAINILEDLHNNISLNYFIKEIEGYLNKGTKKLSKNFLSFSCVLSVGIVFQR